MYRLRSSISRFGLLKAACMLAVLCIGTEITLHAQTVKTLAYFGGTKGASPVGGLIQGSDGNFYGVTSFGGAIPCGIDCSCDNPISGCGTIFKVTSAGVLTTLYNFCAQTYCADGGVPMSGLIQARNGNFYGTTVFGGGNGFGTVFEVTPAGQLTTLYSFPNWGLNATPNGLIQASNGNFYGTTFGGGTGRQGTIFELTPAGVGTTLYNFCSQTNCTDGSQPVGGLIQARNGNFYGTAGGGANNSGTIFKLTPAGVLTTLYNFCSQTNCTDGIEPIGLIQASDGDFYGVTQHGGSNGWGVVYKMTPAGVVTTVYDFAPGYTPYWLIQGKDGNFYGIAVVVPPYVVNYGVVFEVTPAGQFTVIYAFPQKDSNENPNGLMQASNGTFYGTTAGTNHTGDGKVYSLAMAETVTPASFTFAKTTVGKASVAKTFTLTNDEAVALTNIEISTTGEFSISTTTCSTSLAANAKCTISVTFNPTQTGPLTGELIVSDSAASSPQKSSLTGTGE